MTAPRGTSGPPCRAIGFTPVRGRGIAFGHGIAFGRGVRGAFGLARRARAAIGG
ncbi:MAG: hypothetical protein RL477_1431 [Pseudomonadota bacterium]|jgi:hypothetical protein